MKRWLPVPWLVVASCAGPVPLPEQIAADETPGPPAGREAEAAALAKGQEALEWIERGVFDRARAAAEAALDRDPRCVAARIARARCLMHAARSEDPPALRPWRQAEGELLIAERLAPDEPAVQLARAAFLTSDGHLSAAVECLDKALLRQPRHVGLLREAARLRYELGEERAAAELLVRLLGEAPAETAAMFQLAQCRLRIAGSLREDQQKERQEQLLAARRLFSDYRRLQPADADGLLGEAYARFELARTLGAATVRQEGDEIVQLYRLAAALRDLSPEPQFGLGLVQEELGRLAEAEKGYQSALRLDPNHVPSLLNLASLLAKSGRHVEAKALAERSLRLELTPSERREISRYVGTGSR